MLMLTKEELQELEDKKRILSEKLEKFDSLEKDLRITFNPDSNKYERILTPEDIEPKDAS